MMVPIAAYKITFFSTQMRPLFLMLGILVFVHCSENMLVSVQSQSQQDMDLLTAAVDADLQASHSNMRQTLGAIEATMSRVVDVDSDFFVAPVLSVPTWGLLHDIHYDVATSVWTFEYNTMRADPGTLNQFHRVLYMTKAGESTVGDVNNECLLDGVTTSTCLTYLMNHYTVPQSLNEENQDYLLFQESSDDAITSVVSGSANSLTETVTIRIPHTRVRNGPNALAKLTEYNHPTLGLQREWSFGIGVLFHGVGNNLIIFDQFNLIENSFEQLAISRTNTYAMARHVSFWTERVHYDHSIRIATVEYFLSSGYSVVSVNASVNQATITPEECSAMQGKIDALVDKTCIYEHALCVPRLLLESSSGDLVSYAIPLPENRGDEFKVNTVIVLKDKTTDVELMSSLNFQTIATPQDVCATPETKTFDPAGHVTLNLYKGHALSVQVVDGAFLLQNVTDDAMGLPEALLTLTLTPKDSVADTYFADYGNEVISLDELYISHALHGSNLIPDSINNTIVGAAGGRSQVNLDPTLLLNCPLESTAFYETAECITTQDWGLSGHLDRPKSSGGDIYFVRRVTFVPDDIAWLQSHGIFVGSTLSSEFMNNVQNLVTDNSRPMLQEHSAVYWIFPVYSWYDQSPIGLKDKALISFSWSISTGSVSSRRLLQHSEEKPKYHLQRKRRLPSVPVQTPRKVPVVKRTDSDIFDLLKRVKALL